MVCSCQDASFACSGCSVAAVSCALRVWEAVAHAAVWRLCHSTVRASSASGQAQLGDLCSWLRKQRSVVLPVAQAGSQGVVAAGPWSYQPREYCCEGRVGAALARQAAAAGIEWAHSSGSSAFAKLKFCSRGLRKWGWLPSHPDGGERGLDWVCLPSTSPARAHGRRQGAGAGTVHAPPHVQHARTAATARPRRPLQIQARPPA